MSLSVDSEQWFEFSEENISIPKKQAMPHYYSLYKECERRWIVLSGYNAHARDDIDRLLGS